jgi:hypothetical protein
MPPWNDLIGINIVRPQGCGDGSQSLELFHFSLSASVPDSPRDDQ